MTNFAVNQRVWDTNPPVEMCYRKGQEHRAYNWARKHADWWTDAQRDAYDRGYDGRPLHD